MHPTHRVKTTVRIQFCNVPTLSEWGAHAVLAGHDHSYERILRDDITLSSPNLGEN